ncbi:MAG: PGPGW domain-containing protein [Arachnia sp.]
MIHRARELALEVVGWVLLIAGIAALVLPGPGLLMVFAAMLLLSRRYTWIHRRLTYVEHRAMLGAAQGVKSWPRVVISTIGALGIASFGALWLWQPPAPEWWPVAEQWWLYGGRVVGGTLVVSSVVAMCLIGWSLVRFRNHPGAVAELRARIAEEKRQAQAAKAARRMRSTSQDTGPAD